MQRVRDLITNTATNPHGLVPRIVQELKRRFPELGLLTGLDRGLLAAYCQAHALWVEAVSSIGRYGTMVYVRCP